MNEELHYALDLSRQGYTTAAMGIIADVLKRDPEDVEAWAALAQIVEDKDQKRDSLNRILLLTQEESMRTWANEQLALLDQPAPPTPSAPSAPVAASAPAPSPQEPEEEDWSQMLSELAEEPAPGELTPSPLSGQMGEERPELGVDEWSELVQSWGASQPGEEPPEPAEDSWSQMLDEMVEEPEAEAEAEPSPPEPEPEPEPEPQPTEADLDEWAKLLDEAPAVDDELIARTTSDELPGGSDWTELLEDSATPAEAKEKAEAEPEPEPELDLGLEPEPAAPEEDGGEWSKFLDGLAEPEEEEEEEDEWTAMLEDLSASQPVEEETAEEELIEEKPVEEEPVEEELVEEELVKLEPVEEELVRLEPVEEEPVKLGPVGLGPDDTPMIPRSELPITQKRPELEELMPPVEGDKWDEMLVAWGEEPLPAGMPVTGDTQAAQRTDAIHRADIDRVLETPHPIIDDMDTPPIPEPAPVIPQVQELESWAGEQPKTFTVEPPPQTEETKKAEAMTAARLQGAEVEGEKEEDKEAKAAPEEEKRRGGCLRLLLVVLAGLIIGAALMFGLFWLAQTNPQVVANIPLVGGVFVPPTEEAAPTPSEIAAETPAEAIEPSPTIELSPSLAPTSAPTEAASVTPVTSPSAAPTVTPSPILPTPTAIPYGENIFIPPSTTALAVQQIDGFDPDFGRAVLLRGDVIVVGGPFEDSATTDGTTYADAGKIYILQRRGENWAGGVDIVALPSPEPEDDQGFGSAIAFDGETLAVGTRNGDAVYLLQQEEDSWQSIATLTGSGGFGQSVAFDGETLVIGAPEEANGTGAVYIYALSSGTWTQVQELTADDPAEGDRFGQAVAVDAGTIAIGALGAGEALPNAPGAVYVYQVEDGTWEQKNQITVTNDGSFETFGWPLDIAGGMIVVGTRARSFPELPGQAFIFEDTSAPADWRTYIETRLPAPDILGEAQFGTAVATDGEMVAIGAVGLAPSVPGLNPGRLIIYERREGTWAVREVLTAPTAPDTAEFPLSVDIEGMVAITGAPLLDSEGEFGSLIIYELPPE